MEISTATTLAFNIGLKMHLTLLNKQKTIITSDIAMRVHSRVQLQSSRLPKTPFTLRRFTGTTGLKIVPA